MQLYLIGAGVDGDISYQAVEVIKNSKRVILKTDKTNSVKMLNKLGVDFVCIDDEYNRSRNFDTLNKNLAKRVLEYLVSEDVCYIVDGAVSDDISCGILLKKHKNVKVFNGVSKVQNALLKAKISTTSYSATSAYDMENFKRFAPPVVIFDFDSQLLASEWKLKLFEFFGEEDNVFLVNGDSVKKIPLFEIDRESEYSEATALVIPERKLTEKIRFDYIDLLDIVKFLRSENGCPWDKVQTKETIRNSLIEECYELVDAIDKNDDEKICEEIGDVLLQAAFHTVLADEKDSFNSADVLSGICYKLISRHTHVFGNDKAETVNSVLNVWDKNKIKEKGFENELEYVKDVPNCFPSLLRAKKILKRSDCYFDTTDKEQAFTELVDYINNFEKDDETNIDELDNEKLNQFGNILLMLSKLLSIYKVDGEEALKKAIDSFISKLEKLKVENKSNLFKVIKGEV